MSDYAWKYTAAILCAVGLFKEFTPSAPFLLEYAVDYRNLTSHVVTHEILPVTTYGYLGCLIIILFITDYLKYKPIIILGGVSAVATWSITIWFYNDKFHASLRQIAYSISSASDVAYLTYLYANVERQHYKEVTSYTHSAMHLGKFLGDIVGQLLLSYHVVDLTKLNYLSLAGVILFFSMALFLPRVNRSIYFHPRANSAVSVLSGLGVVKRLSICDATQKGNKNVGTTPRTKRSQSIYQLAAKYPFRKQLKRALRACWRDFKIAYFNRYVLRWSLWWSIAYAIYLQIGMYSESLWKEIEDETHEHNLNGAIDASHALLSAVFAIVIQYVRLPWQKWGEIYLSFISIIQGAIILVMSQTHHLYIAYICYILFQTLFQVVIIVASCEVAESVKEDSEAFIFGINTLLALVIQSILTLLITGEQGFELDIRDEFVVYGVYSSLLGMVFLLIAIQNRNKHWDIHSEQPNRKDCVISENAYFERKCSVAVISLKPTEDKTGSAATSAAAAAASAQKIMNGNAMNGLTDYPKEKSQPAKIRFQNDQNTDSADN